MHIRLILTYMGTATQVINEGCRLCTQIGVCESEKAYQLARSATSQSEHYQSACLQLLEAQTEACELRRAIWDEQYKNSENGLFKPSALKSLPSTSNYIRDAILLHVRSSHCKVRGDFLESELPILPSRSSRLVRMYQNRKRTPGV